MHLGELRADLYLSITLDTRVQSHAFPMALHHSALGNSLRCGDSFAHGRSTRCPSAGRLGARHRGTEGVETLEDLEPGVEALEDLEPALAVSSGHDVVLDDVVSACPTGEMLRFSLLEARIERRLPVQPERCFLALGFSFAVVPI